ncbi:hypothetical protein SAMN05192575_102131 [Nocardioides alpinus]|uniref:4-amino-4-deoxy-L-arabinose transferase n=1 Tax=Nocardioides alpinus TaxID=748909 RepID=A0A1I0X463_9ACTN|nr:hypothetical protein [Nocardioides alpinus]SFA95795.1 hypothetical protein SAMN05192575_102131 [Nocardioides alpinus]
MTSPRFSPRVLLSELPAALLVGLAVVTTATLALGEIEQAPLRHPVVVLTLVSLFVAVMSALTWWFSGRSTPPPSWVGLFPTGWVLSVGLVGLLSGGPERVGWFLGGDNVRHLALVAEIVDVETLDYSDASYPRAWHTGVSLVWLLGHHGVDESSLSSFIGVNAGATWLLFVLLVLATSNFAASLARIVSPQVKRVEAGAALVAGFAVMTPRFMADTMALGFQTSILASVILAVVARECVIRRRTLESFVVLISGVVLMAHTWQLLLPAVAVPAAVFGWQLFRRDWRAKTVAAAIASVGALASLPPVLAVVAGPGIAATTAEGVVSEPAWIVLVGSLGAAAFVLRRLPQRRALAAGGLLLAPALFAAVLSATGNISLTAYYPSKLLWHSAALGLSYLAVVGVSAAVQATQATLPLRLGGALLGVFMACVILLGCITPFRSQMGGWSTVDPARVLAASTATGASGAEAVWLESATESAVTRTLLMTLKGGRLSADRLTVAEECVALRVAETPTVVTSHSEASAIRRYDCVGRLFVLTARE